MELRNLGILLLKELADAWRNRWFLVFAGAFTVLALAMSWLSLVGAAESGFAGLGRTAASLVNLVVLIVPLMGLTLGAGGIAAERERGSLLYLMAQPVSAGEVVLGKFLGQAVAVVASLSLGFGIAALAIARRGGGGDAGPFLAFLGLAALVAMGAVSLGLLISALASRGSVASGVALMSWLLLVFLGDLGIMGTSVVMRLPAAQILGMALVNPLQEFKVAALLVLRGGLDVLGPGGLYATRTFGGGLLPLLVGCLVLWSIVPLAATAWITGRRGAV